MTWKEFKDKIDLELTNNGLDDSINIYYIDIPHNPSIDFLDITIVDNKLIID